MKGSAYDDVSIRQLLTMTSGVRWNEDYADPKSDVAQFNNHKPEEGVDALVSYMRKLPREVPAGTRWNYSTGETNLVGILVKPGHEEAAGHLPVGKDLGARRHGAAGHLDSEQDRAGDQRLLHPGRAARLCALRPVHPERRAVGGKPIVPEGWLERPPPSAPPSASPGAATATSGGPTTTAPSPPAASSARASSSTPSASW
jgi:hypothetical protein